MDFQTSYQTLVILFQKVNASITATTGRTLGVVPEIHQVMASCTHYASNKALFLGFVCKKLVVLLDSLRD